MDRAAEAIADYGVAAIVLTLPLEFTTRLLQQQVSRFVMLVVALAYAYLLMRGRRTLLIPRAPSVWLLLVLIAFSLASWLVTRAPGATNSVADVVLYPVVGVLIANLALTREDHRRAWIAFVVSALGVSLLGAGLYFAHAQIWAPNPAVAHRLNITFADPNITARFLTLGACAAVLVFAARQGPAWLPLAAAVACGIVLPLTYSRSGLALFILMVAMTIPIAFDRKRAAAIAAAALVAFGLSTTINPDTRQRAAEATTTVVDFVTGAHQATRSAPGVQGDVSLDDNRVYLIAAGLKMFADHPLLGVGFGGYQHALLTTYRRFLPDGYTDSVSHTTVVTTLAEQGVAGALLLFAFLLQLAREAWVAPRRAGDWDTWTTLPAALIVPIFLYSQFEGRFLQEPYLWLALGMFYAAQQASAGSRTAVLGAGRVPREKSSVEAA
jgi:O-antigen ligase